VFEAPAAMGRFLASTTGRTTRVAALPSGTAIILFADVVDSTSLTERMGDIAFRERARALDVSLRGVIRGPGGDASGGKAAARRRAGPVHERAAGHRGGAQVRGRVQPRGATAPPRDTRRRRDPRRTGRVRWGGERRRPDRGGIRRR